MANRVLLGERGAAHGLWVSKPGANVINAGYSDLLFTSEWSALSALVTATHTITWASSYSVSYGQSFPSVPFVLFERLIGGGRRLIGGPGGFNWNRYVDIYDENDDQVGTAYANIAVRAGTSGLSISTSFDGYWNDVNPPSFQFRYQVLSYNL